MANLDEFANRSDVELLELALSGQESAFLLLYEKLKVKIFRYAFYMTGSRAEAEEVTQEVFMSLLKEGRNYEPSRGEVAAFAFGIARNFVRRIMRRERAYLPLPASDSAAGDGLGLPGANSSVDALPGQLIRNELVDKLHAALASLPDHYRQAVVLCDLCEFSYADAALQLRCAVGTVRSRLNRAHSLLAQKLKP
ncbi:MAG: RNA polymerase sigma factor, partial [Chthoniobacterales bacterium]